MLQTQRAARLIVKKRERWLQGEPENFQEVETPQKGWNLSVEMLKRTAPLYLGCRSWNYGNCVSILALKENLH